MPPRKITARTYFDFFALFVAVRYSVLLKRVMLMMTTTTSMMMMLMMHDNDAFSFLLAGMETDLPALFPPVFLLSSGR